MVCGLVDEWLRRRKIKISPQLHYCSTRYFILLSCVALQFNSLVVRNDCRMYLYHVAYVVYHVTVSPVIQYRYLCVNWHYLLIFCVPGIIGETNTIIYISIPIHRYEVAVILYCTMHSTCAVANCVAASNLTQMLPLDFTRRLILTSVCHRSRWSGPSTMVRGRRFRRAVIPRSET